MANKQIHELPVEAQPSTVDLIAISTASGQLTRSADLESLPVRASHPGAIDRKLGEKSAETISVGDFGAIGDGISDDTQAFLAALQSGVSKIEVPAGRYRLTQPMSIPNGRKLSGAGKHAATLVSEHAGNLLSVSPDAAGMCRCALEGLSFEIGTSGNGLLVQGQDVTLRDLQFSGSQANGWGIDFLDCRGAQLHNLSFGGPARDFFANGMRWRDSSPQAVSNFGESTIIGVDIRLGSVNTKGIHFAASDGGLINNMFLSHVRISAPQLNGAPIDGSIGLHMQSTVRSTVMGLSLEALSAGVLEEGTTDGLGACVANQYFGVSAINVGTAYDDSNDTVARSVQQRVFSGCDNFPATTGLNDGDSVIPAGLWLQSFVSGANAVRLRCFSGHELILDDGAEQGALSLDVGGSSPRVAPKEAGLLTRLYIGRGSTPSNNTMRDVTVEPVLRLAPRDSQNPGTTTGQLVYADGTNWDPGKGEGFYAFERGAWRKLAFEA